MTADLPKRPKTLTDFIALLDENWWTYRINHLRASGGEPYIVVDAAPGSWDPFTKIRVTWHTVPHGTLRLDGCSVATHKLPWHDVSLRDARALVVPEPEDANVYY